MVCVYEEAVVRGFAAWLSVLLMLLHSRPAVETGLVAPPAAEEELLLSQVQLLSAPQREGVLLLSIHTTRSVRNAVGNSQKRCSLMVFSCASSLNTVMASGVTLLIMMQ